MIKKLENAVWGGAHLSSAAQGVEWQGDKFKVEFYFWKGQQMFSFFLLCLSNDLDAQGSSGRHRKTSLLFWFFCEGTAPSSIWFQGPRVHLSRLLLKENCKQSSQHALWCPKNHQMKQTVLTFLSISSPTVGLTGTQFSAHSSQPTDLLR